MYGLHHNTVTGTIGRTSVGNFKKNSFRKLAAFVLSGAILANTVSMDAFAAQSTPLSSGKATLSDAGIIPEGEAAQELLPGGGTVPGEASGSEVLTSEIVSGKDPAESVGAADSTPLTNDSSAAGVIGSADALSPMNGGSAAGITDSSDALPPANDSPTTGSSGSRDTLPLNEGSATASSNGSISSLPPTDGTTPGGSDTTNSLPLNENTATASSNGSADSFPSTEDTAADSSSSTDTPSLNEDSATASSNGSADSLPPTEDTTADSSGSADTPSLNEGSATASSNGSTENLPSTASGNGSADSLPSTASGNGSAGNLSNTTAGNNGIMNGLPLDILSGILANNHATVSMSDPLRLPGLNMYSAASSLDLDVHWPSGYNASNEELTVSDSMSFSMIPRLSGSTASAPTLRIQIPSCMVVTEYPDENDTELKAYYASTNPFSKEQDGDGNTILTYRFIPNVNTVYFTINAKITSGLQLKNGEVYSIKLDYYDGTTPLQSTITKDFKIKNTTAGSGGVWLSNYPYSETVTLEENTTSSTVYDVGPYSWTVSATSGHYPYDWLKMTVPLPPGAVPGFGYGSGFTPLQRTQSVTYSGKTYKITYDGNALIFEIPSGASFLKSGSSFTFSGNQGLYLRFTGPQATTYTSTTSPRIECGVDGKSIEMRPSSSQPLISVTFQKLPEWDTVEPYTEWNDTIYLKDDASVYYTKEYIRRIYADPGHHVTYDSLKMTVPLPQGAVPVFKQGDTYVDLSSGTAYDNGSFYVTYQQNGYSKDNISYGVLIYEIRSGSSFLSSGSDFTFSGPKEIYLRFTDPKAGTYRSPVSPKIEVTRKGNTEIKYNHGASYYHTTVQFIELSKKSSIYPDYAYNNRNYGWSQTIKLEEDKTVYYTSLYSRTVYSPASPPHYPYDRVRMTVLLPDEATPGFGTGDTFTPLKDGETYTMSNGLTNNSYSYSTWKLTYDADYKYSNGKTAQALIYDLDSAFSTAAFLKSTTTASFYTFGASSGVSGLYLRFENPEPKTYSSAAAPKVESWIDGKSFVWSGSFSATTTDTQVTFETPKTDWSLLSISGSTNATPYGISSYYVLPEAYQNDKEYYGSIYNNTGYTLQDVTVSYTFDNALSVDQLKLNLDGNGYPANATIVYTTRQDQTPQTVRLDASGSVLALEKGNAFLTAEITYDTLGSASSSKRILTASVHNYDNRQEPSSPLSIIAVPLSAKSKIGSSGDYNFKSGSYSFYLMNTSFSLSASVSIDKTTLSKSSAGNINTFNVTVTTSGSAKRYQNLHLYLRMPKGYILTGYKPPTGCKDGEYNVTRRVLDPDTGELLYCLAYTDDVMYSGGSHVFSFRVGSEADTSEAKTITLPTKVYAAAGEGTLFQFSSTTPESTLQLDVNGDGDMEDSFQVLNGRSVQIEEFGLVSLGSYLSTDGQVGEDENNKYGVNSKGSYRFIIYNGTKSDSAVVGAVCLINLHKSGDTFTYNKEEYLSQYDVLLTGPVRPQGSFWEDCTVQYSTDGKEWLNEDQVKDYTLISCIKVTAAADKILNSAQSAYLDLSFIVGFPDNETAENKDGYKAYIDTQLEYIYDPDQPPIETQRLSELTAIPLEFSGTVFQDRNWNGTQDTTEAVNDKAYTLRLYSGNGTEGKQLQEITTDKDSGAYSFQTYLPGTYTLHIEKGEGEFYGAGEHFDDNGNYIFTLGDTSKEPVTKGLNMGILSGLLPPELSAFPEQPDGKDGWYVTLPQLSLLPVMSSDYVDTMFQCNDGTAQKQTPEIRPSVEGTGIYTFNAYNMAVLRNETAYSDTRTLELKVDMDAPVITERFFYSITGTSSLDKVGNFLTFGNFFRESLRVTIQAEDEGSGVSTLYYTLPGEEEQTASPDKDGAFQFDIPMDTTGKITYYVEDKAGNKSSVFALKKEEGSELWMLEDKGPVWEDFLLTDADGNTGVRGADGGVWFAGAVNASARVTDEDSGLALIRGSVNEEPLEEQNFAGDEKLTAFDFSAAVDTEGNIFLWAEAEDNATNSTATQTAFGIDKTPPVITLEEKKLENGACTATVLVQDAGSGIDQYDIHVLWQDEDVDFQMTAANDATSRMATAGGSSYRLTFDITALAHEDKDAAFLVTAKDYTGWSAELPVTRWESEIIYVAADTGSDETGNGSRRYPFRTLETALDHVSLGGRIVLLEDYNGTARVDLEVTLDLNGKVLQADVPGSALTVGPSGSLTITDSNGSASMADGFDRDPESEGEIFGGIPGDPAFTLEDGVLCLADGTIYCGYTGNGSVDVQDEARMMYLLTYLNGGGTGEAPELHYIEENTTDALKPNTFVNEGYSFRGWLYEDQLYEPGDEIRMPGRNMETLAMWEISDEDDNLNLVSERGRLDPVPKTGTGEAGQRTATHAERMEFYIEIRKREDEQSADG